MSGSRLSALGSRLSALALLKREALPKDVGTATGLFVGRETMPKADSRKPKAAYE